MNETVITDFVARLASDQKLAAAIRANLIKSAHEFGLPQPLFNAISANRAADPQPFFKMSDTIFMVEGKYTTGGKCSTACTQAGCYTGGGNCPSNYACTGVKPKC
jgi:hypothetical protein